MQERRLQQIGFVTRGFADLQGLYVVTFGAMLLALCLCWSLIPAEQRHLQQILLNLNIMLMSGIRLLFEFYERTFGRTVVRLARGGAASSAQAVALWVFAGVALDGLRMFSNWRGPSVGCAVWTALSLWILARDISFRWHYVVGVCGGIAGLLLTSSAPFEPAHADLATLPYVNAFVVLGFSLVFCGILDHRLVLVAMVHRASAAETQVRPDPLMARTRAALGLVCGSVAIVAVAVGGPAVSPLLLFLALQLPLMALAFVAAARGLSTRRAVLFEYPGPETAAVTLDGDDGPGDSSVCGRTASQPFDPVGHLLLPILVAGAVCWATIGTDTRGIAAIGAAFGLSHLWIAVRDWPQRRHYIAGVIGGLAGSILSFTLTTRAEAAIVLLIWLSGASAVEGILDLPSREDRDDA